MLAALAAPALGSLDEDNHPVCGGNGCWSHGVCIGGQCQCDAGYGGDHCRELLDDFCPQNCGGHGECDDAGVCHCHPGYYGSDCSYIQPYSCPDNCGGHGECVRVNGTSSASHCVCDAGFTGEGCDTVAPVCPASCSGHGLCSPAGTCTCHVGYRGPACNIVESHECFRHCSGRGLCRDGTCECEAGFGGSGCETAVAYERCPDFCSGHGVCRGEAGCQCLETNATGLYNYEGASCARVAEKAGCEYGCSGRGVCRPKKGHPEQGRCACYAPGRNGSYHGAYCEEEMQCANRCNGPNHGTCVLGLCSCTADWSGATCDEPRCDEGNCSGHGACRAASIDGGRPSCVCDNGYSGFDCSVEVPYCPNDCSAHGECRAAGANASAAALRCVCAAGYTGDDCGLLEGAPISAAARRRALLAQLGAPGARVVEAEATRLTLGMAVEGAAAELSPERQAHLVRTLRTMLGCLAPLCAISLSLEPPPRPPYDATTRVEAQVEVRRGATPDAAAVARAARTVFGGSTLAQLSAKLQVSVEARDALKVEEGVRVFTAVTSPGGGGGGGVSGAGGSPLAAALHADVAAATDASNSNATTPAQRVGACDERHCGSHGRCLLTATALLCACHHGYGGFKCEFFHGVAPAAPARLTPAQVQALVAKNQGAKGKCPPPTAAAAGQQVELAGGDAAHGC